jgi:hypothetical protein
MSYKTTQSIGKQLAGESYEGKDEKRIAQLLEIGAIVEVKAEKEAAKPAEKSKG